MPVAFEGAWVLAALVQPNHIVSLCSGTSLACRRRVTSIPFGMVLFLKQFLVNGLLEWVSNCARTFITFVKNAERPPQYNKNWPSTMAKKSEFDVWKCLSATPAKRGIF